MLDRSERPALTMRDLAGVFFRLEIAPGKWGNVNARDATDAQFQEWAASRREIQGPPGPWSQEERLAFCNMLWQENALYVVIQEDGASDGR